MGQPRNILVFGATGSIGITITTSLLSAKSSFHRIAIFTSPATEESKPHLLRSLKEEGVEIIIGNIHDEFDILKAYEGK